MSLVAPVISGLRIGDERSLDHDRLFRSELEILADTYGDATIDPDAFEADGSAERRVRRRLEGLEARHTARILCLKDPGRCNTLGYCPPTNK